MNDSYVISTQKSWEETLIELAETMKKWGMKEWETAPPRGARSERWQQSEKDRTIKLTYVKQGKPVPLSMGKQQRAVDNLRVLYLAVEAIRLNEVRGIAEVIESAYCKLLRREKKPIHTMF